MFRKILLAALQIPNIILLLIAIFASRYWFWTFPIGLAAIIFLTLRNVGRDSFSEEFNKKEVIRSIRELNSKCDKLADGPKNSTNIEKRTRVRKVIKAKDDVISTLYSDKYSGLKQRIASQALELVAEYLNLIESYYSRLGAIDENSIKQLEDRIADNKKVSDVGEQKKPGFEGIIEVDERLLSKLRDEKEELSRINSKLNSIESSINLFEQYIKDDIYSDNNDSNINEIINEAVALDNVMSQKGCERNKA